MNSLHKQSGIQAQLDMFTADVQDKVSISVCLLILLCVLEPAYLPACLPVCPPACMPEKQITLHYSNRLKRSHSHSVIFQNSTITRLRATHEDSVVSLLGHMPQEDLRDSLEDYIRFACQLVLSQILYIRIYFLNNLI